MLREKTSTLREMQASVLEWPRIDVLLQTMRASGFSYYQLQAKLIMKCPGLKSVCFRCRIARMRPVPSTTLHKITSASLSPRQFEGLLLSDVIDSHARIETSERPLKQGSTLYFFPSFFFPLHNKCIRAISSNMLLTSITRASGAKEDYVYAHKRKLAFRSLRVCDSRHPSGCCGWILAK